MILQDREYREIQRMARSLRMSVAEWIRQALELARGEFARAIMVDKTE